VARGLDKTEPLLKVIIAKRRESYTLPHSGVPSAQNTDEKGLFGRAEGGFLLFIFGRRLDCNKYYT